MRNISAASLAKISGTSNIEPVIVVRIWWGVTSYTTYADKKFTQQGLVGKLIEISGIEDIVDINASSSSVNMSITLDDSDGSIKNIFDYNDIHKTFIQVLQWFADLPLSEAFPLFEGELSSPIIWSEGDRTMKFDVVSMLEDQEVGYSADESQFNYMPSDLVGQAWPVVFGTIKGLKPLAINESPSAILASGFGIVNDDAWNVEFANLNLALQDAQKNADYAYQLGIGEAILAAHYKEFGIDIGIITPGGIVTEPNNPDPGQADQHDTAASGYYAQATQYRQEYQKLALELTAKQEEYEFDKSLEFRVLPITQTNLPSGVTFTAEIGNYTCSALIIGSSVIISNLTEKVDINSEVGTSDYKFNTGNGTINQYDRTDAGSSQKFVWIDGGTTIKVFEFPVQYIASIGYASVLNVYAQSKYGRALVPRNYYTVTYKEFPPQSTDLVNFASLRVTYVTIPIPLQTLDSEFWHDGSIEIDVANNDPGMNTVDIMIWAIVYFSGLNYDPWSFAYVRAKVANFPANFVLQERKNVMEFLKDVAFQSRCAIWINDRIFYIQYLPEDLPAIESVTDNDVEMNSLVVTSTETERLVTKFVANWRSSASQDKPNQIILRYNIKNYGSIEEQYDFYIYNNYNAVVTAAQFWMIRKSNTFKLLQCKVALNKLRIEAFDYVNFTFTENLVAIGTIKGHITKCTFNPDDDSLSLEAWLPVRFGEMVRYEFAYPGTTQAIYPPLTDPNIITGNPFADAFVGMDTNLYFPPTAGITYSHRNPPTYGTGDYADAPPIPNTIITALDPKEIGKGRPADPQKKNNTTKREVLPVKISDVTLPTASTYYGAVLAKKSDVLYSCEVYLRGFENLPQTFDVKIGKIREGATIPNGYPLVVNRTIWRETDASGTAITKVEYWAQPPVWAAPPDES